MGRWVGGCSGWGVVVGGWWGNCSKKRQFVGNLKTQAIFVDIFSTTSLQCFNLKLVTWLRRCGECCHLSMCDMERNLIFWISVKKRGRLSPSTFTRTEFSTEISGLLGRARQEESGWKCQRGKHCFSSKTFSTQIASSAVGEDERCNITLRIPAMAKDCF